MKVGSCALSILLNGINAACRESGVQHLAVLHVEPVRIMPDASCCLFVSVIPGTPERCTELWVDKYKPQTISDLVGNTSTIQELRKWIVHWKENHGSSNTTQKSSASQKTHKKAVLLSGSPGVGKTSTARIVAE